MNFIKCEKLEKSMAELQFSIDAEAFKKADRKSTRLNSSH